MKTINKVLAVTLLITVILIGVAMPAQAVAPPIGAIEMIGEAMAMEMGIGAGLEFSSSSAAKSFSEGLYDYLKAEIDALIMSASVIYTGLLGGYKLVANVTSELWSNVRDYVGLNYDEGINGVESYVSAEVSTNIYPLIGIYAEHEFLETITNNGDGSFTSVKYFTDGTYFTQYTLNCQDQPYYQVIAYNDGYKLTIYDFYNQSYTALGTRICSSVSVAQIISTGVNGTIGVVDNPNHDLYNGQTGGRDIGLDVLPVPPYEADIPINDSLGFSIPDTVYDDAVGRTYEDVQAVPVLGTNVGSLAEIEYPAVWEDSDNYRVNLMQVFPFCIPFDIVSLFQAFAAEPVAPVVDYAFIVPSLGVNVPITVDLSIFDTVAAIVRTCELVAFALGLMFITYKVIKW